MPYLIVIFILTLRTLTVVIIDRFLTPLLQNNKRITQLLNDELSKHTPTEEGESKEIPFRLRVLSYFLEEQNVDKSDAIRVEMNNIVKRENGKPVKAIALFITKIVVSTIFFFSTLIFAYSEPIFWLSIIVIAITVAFWIYIKRYILAFLSLIASIYIYRYLPATSVLYLGFVLLLQFFKIIRMKRKH